MSSLVSVVRRWPILLAAFALALALPATAAADSDPASDFLPTANVFYPYTPAVPRDVKADLEGITAAAKKAGYPIKVAIIATAADLGGVPQLFNQPMRYADFLGHEISFGGKPQPLVVVMPAGLGVFQAGPKASSVVAGAKVGPGGRGLGLTALEAVRRLAAAAGHPIQGFKPKSTSSGGTSAVIFAIPIVLLVLLLAVLSYRRIADDEEEDDEPERERAPA